MPVLLLVIVSSSTVEIVALFLLSPVMILEIRVGSSLTFSPSSTHIYALLLLNIRQELGNKLCGNVAHVQISC
jgi:hypothetical protein